MPPRKTEDTAVGRACWVSRRGEKPPGLRASGASEWPQGRTRGKAQGVRPMSPQSREPEQGKQRRQVVPPRGRAGLRRRKACRHKLGGCPQEPSDRRPEGQCWGGHRPSTPPQESGGGAGPARQPESADAAGEAEAAIPGTWAGGRKHRPPGPRRLQPLPRPLPTSLPCTCAFSWFEVSSYYL